MLQRQQQQSTDSAISVSVSLEDNDDVLSTASSASSPFSPLRLYATPTASCDVTSGRVPPVARLRRGMTLSGDDLYPARMRTSLSMTTRLIDDDDTGRPTTDDVTKHQSEPSEPTHDTAVIDLRSEQPEHQEDADVSVSGELERVNVVIRRRENSLQQHHVCRNEDSGRSTSDDYDSDYEDGGTEFRWRDDTTTKSARRRGVRQRRSYCVTRRRRRDVTRSQSDSVRA